ncbi:MAG: fatty acid oxidation complex subunit alpha FadJ [Halobacteriovoraceae bacterium]|nr:fatty acid oxidation complex subunit alpha FadJ [Halobacteriovoraceae bacterium]
MDFQKISFVVTEGIAEVGLGFKCDKSLPLLDKETLKELDEALNLVKEREQEGSVKGVLFFSHHKRAFLAGVDIQLISDCKTESEGAEGAEKGQSLFNKIEDLSIPSICCVHGLCLGGGLELALSCDRIIASDSQSTFLGLPEVKLGLIPGFGGTFRLPRKIGLPKALDAILSGKNIYSKKAKRMGLVEGIFPKERVVTMARVLLDEAPKSKSFKESLENLASDNFLARKIVFQKARETVLRKTQGFYQAPLKILDVIESGFSKGRSSYLAMEAQAFGELCSSGQSQNLQHLFFLNEASKKVPKNYDSGKKPKELNRGAVIGAGVMGAGICWLMAKNKMYPHLVDLTFDALEAGIKQSSHYFLSQVKRKRMSYDELHILQSSITTQTNMKALGQCNLIVESVVEDLEVKKKLLQDLEDNVSDDAILASNTSSLGISEMAKNLKKPERFAGLHFFNPVPKMPLVEIVTHEKTSKETILSLHNWCLRGKKTPIIVKDGPGFLVNRILAPYLNEAGHLMAEGVSPRLIEDACLNYGMPMGPIRLLDEIGQNVASKVAFILQEKLGERLKPSSLMKDWEASDFQGRKNSKGFYEYDEKGAEIDFSEAFLKVLPSPAKPMNEIEIQMRIFLPMINEAAFILEEKIVEHASTVDLALIYGIGFPPFRGGLLKYADQEGLERILEALIDFSKNVNQERYAPSPLLKKLVADKKKFYD